MYHAEENIMKAKEMHSGKGNKRKKKTVKKRVKKKRKRKRKTCTTERNEKNTGESGKERYKDIECVEC